MALPRNPALLLFSGSCFIMAATATHKSCSSHSDCPVPNEACHTDSCSVRSCLEDLDCGDVEEDLACNKENACVPIPCSLHTDCPATDLTCHSGKCSVRSCLEDLDCGRLDGSGLVCDKRKDVCVPKKKKRLSYTDLINLSQPKKVRPRPPPFTPELRKRRKDLPLPPDLIKFNDRRRPFNSEEQESLNDLIKLTLPNVRPRPFKPGKQALNRLAGVLQEVDDDSSSYDYDRYPVKEKKKKKNVKAMRTLNTAAEEVEDKVASKDDFIEGSNETSEEMDQIFRGLDRPPAGTYRAGVSRRKPTRLWKDPFGLWWWRDEFGWQRMHWKLSEKKKKSFMEKSGKRAGKKK